MGLLPRQADVPHPRQARQSHRLRWTTTHRAARRCARLQPQIHQYFSHSHFRQAQFTLRHPPRPLRNPRVQHRHHRRRLHGCHRRPPARLYKRSSLYGHRTHRKSGLAAKVPCHQLRPGPRPRHCRTGSHPSKPRSLVEGHRHPVRIARPLAGRPVPARPHHPEHSRAARWQRP